MQLLLESLYIGILLVVLFGLLLIVASIFFQFCWLIPFVPTPMPIVATMLDLAKLKPGDHVLDLGAGDARFLIEAKKREPGITCIGYEGAIAVWMLGKVRIFFSGQRGIQFRCSNFMKEDFSKADVVFVYLSMHVMKMLLPKFQRELKPGTKILSHAFRLPDMEPVAVADVPMRFGGQAQAFVYVWQG